MTELERLRKSLKDHQRALDDAIGADWRDNLAHACETIEVRIKLIENPEQNLVVRKGCFDGLEGYENEGEPE